SIRTRSSYSCSYCLTLPKGIIDPRGGQERYSLWRCEVCGHVVTSPIPDQILLSTYYPAKYYSYVERTDAGVLGRFKRWLYQGAEDPLGRIVHLFLSRHVAILPVLGRGGNLLDVGCGTGRFLSLMRDVGWKTYGTDISPQAVEVANRNGHQVSCGDMRQAGFPDNFFDLITLNNVLEHLYDPVATLQDLHRMLRPGGELIICVPNFDCYERQVFRQHWGPLKVPVHFHHFSTRSLRLAVERASLVPFLTKQPIRIRIARNLKGFRRGAPRSISERLRVYAGSGLLIVAYPILCVLSLFLEVPKSGMFLTVHAIKEDR
ncbi:MAG: class I SAM-dependent methyltransferase, partial [Candidatus Rokuibacteriota bacterium]